MAKYKVNAIDCRRIFRKWYPSARIVSVTPLPSGVNINVLVRLNNKGAYILRLFPQESWKALKEHALYTLLRTKASIPVPQVMVADTSFHEIPLAYLVLEYIEGISLDAAFSKSKNQRLFYEAGRILGHLHTITLPTYGWLSAGSIENSHSDWKAFLRDDFDAKLTSLKTNAKTTNLVPVLRKRFASSLRRVPRQGKPVLLHKDYHGSHIIAQGTHIRGIIDFEWAIAGRPGLDLIKPHWWLFEQFPSQESIFMAGYRSVHPQFVINNQEMRFYELYTAVGLVAFSIERVISKWLAPNLERLKTILIDNH